MKMNNSFFLLFCLAVLAVTFSACEEDPVLPPTNCTATANTTIAELKALHQSGQEELIEDDIVIEGIVVADDASGNYFRAIILQDETAGIEVRFGPTDLYTQYPRGRKLTIRCQGLTLSDYNGLTQLGTIEQALMRDIVCKGDLDQVVEPKLVTIADLNEDLISTLVTLQDVQFASGSYGVPYADFTNLQAINHTLEECGSDETLIVRTSGYADFAGFLTPTGSGSITGIYSVFGTDQQLFVRDENDADMTKDRCNIGIVAGLSQDFQGLPDGNDLDLSGWFNISVKGSRVWRSEEFDGNVYAQATAFGDTNAEMEAWLITPGIDLSTPRTMTFESAMAFFDHDGMSVWISTDFDGANIGTATWEQLNPVIASSSSSDHTWIPSGLVDLSGYEGIGYIAFRYEGSGPNNLDTSFRIDNLVIE